MRVLHIVERDAEAAHVVLETSDGLEKFELAIDQALRDALTERPVAVSTAPAQPAAATAAPRISPREIQMRVRAGESAQELAEAHGAGLDWIQRFAGPVLAERARIADEGRRMKARRSTTEGQTVVFGDAVDERFAAHGIEPGAVSWDAHRRDDAQWIITARWVGGQSEHTAEWACNLVGRTVAPVDDTAADLLSDRPIRPVTVPAEAEASVTTTPPLEPGLVAFPAMPDAHTGPLPRAEELFDQARFDHEPHLPLQHPDLPDHPSTSRIPKVTNLGVAHRDDETEEDKAARASIPSWDDILLGVRRKHD